ncbi:serine/threonine-protein kinase [Streptomyces griseus]|uniref:serine/threonine-protein kinase n=1 Tax=Streptomyces griseus TaxID=1911 RepID=UPI00083FDCE9|nr:serine/threonine-protein kinase [Streptomyces griseus]
MGEVFAGRYELVDPVGRGGVGAVWRAWDHRRRRYVAAKVLQQSDAHTLLRFVREQALRIEHPHVLAPASWAADDDKVLFTMDLVRGGSLAHVIGDYGPLPPRFVCLLLDQLLSGLATVHAEGVVHRDIKPANILMEATGTGRPHLRLSDFGISMRKGEPRLTETDYVVGTPGYFAPEQLTGAEPDFPADLFAVGLVALHLLRGRKPDAQALVEHFAAHGTPGAPQGVPEPLWQVVAGLLQPDPQARFRTATGARKALTTAAEMLPEPGIDDEPVEIFDQIGPLPAGFGPDGPVHAPQATAGSRTSTDVHGAPAPHPEPEPRGAGRHRLAPPAPSTAETGGPRPVPPPQRAAPPPPGRPYGPPPPGQPYGPPPHPATAVPADASALAQAPTAPVPYGTPPTRAYTAEHPQALPPEPPLPGAPHPAAPPPGTTAAPPGPVPRTSSRTRPGPPPKVAIPVLLVALVCFAVGIWALTQA